MLKGISLKRFSPLDHLSRILEIENGSFNEIDAFSESDFIDYHSQYPDSFIVAESDGKPAGYIIADFSDKAHIESIAVDQKYRKNGVGQVLMNWAEDVCRQKEIDAIRLEVRPSNTDARDFYTKKGYKVVGREKNFYGDEDALVMQKTL